MIVKLTCPSCGQKLRAKGRSVGRSFPCPACCSPVAVPAAFGRPVAPPLALPADEDGAAPAPDGRLIVIVGGLLGAWALLAVVGLVALGWAARRSGRPHAVAPRPHPTTAWRPLAAPKVESGPAGPDLASASATAGPGLLGLGPARRRANHPRRRGLYRPSPANRAGRREGRGAAAGPREQGGPQRPPGRRRGVDAGRLGPARVPAASGGQALST